MTICGMGISHIDCVVFNKFVLYQDQICHITAIPVTVSKKTDPANVKPVTTTKRGRFISVCKSEAFSVQKIKPGIFRIHSFNATKGLLLRETISYTK